MRGGWRQALLSCQRDSDGDESASTSEEVPPAIRTGAPGVADSAALYEPQAPAGADTPGIAVAAVPAQGVKHSRAGNAKKAREALAKKRAKAQGTKAIQQSAEYIWTEGEQKAAKTILGDGGAVNMATVKKLTGVSKYFLLTLVPVAGQTILDLDHSEFMRLLEAISSDVDSGSLRGVAFLFFRGHDETPAVAREIVSEAGRTRVSKARTAKVFAQRLKWRMVLAKLRCHSDVERDGWDYIHIHGRLASRLCSMQSQTAENLLKAIRTHGWLPEAALAIIDKVFPLRGVVVLTDSLPATLKAERGFGCALSCDGCRTGSPCHAAASSQGSGNAGASSQGPRASTVCWKHGHIRCRIHRAHTSHKITSDLAGGVVTGLVNTTLLLRSPGVIDRMKNVMREKCKSVIIKRGRLPPDVVAWRKSVEECFMERDSPRTHRRKAVWDLLWNGDGREGRMEHYCRGCCDSKEKTILKMQTDGIDALMGVAPPEYPRKSWKGADETLDAIGVVEAMHRMFSESLLPQTAEVPAEGHQAPAPAQGHDGAEDRDLKRETLYRRATTKKFIRGPTFFADLVAQRRIAAVFSNLKYSMLHETSEEWELRQLCQEAHLAEQTKAAAQGEGAGNYSAAPPQGGAEANGSSDASSKAVAPRSWAIWRPAEREYRAAVGFRQQNASRVHLAQISRMFLDRNHWNTDFALSGPMPHHDLSRKHQDSFRMLSRAGACVQQHVSKLEQRYPAKLTAMLEQPELLRTVLGDFAQSPGALDSLSYEIVRRYFSSSTRAVAGVPRTAVPRQG